MKHLDLPTVDASCTIDTSCTIDRACTVDRACTIDRVSTKSPVSQCSKCLGDTEYYCLWCLCDLCSQCKQNHEQDRQTKEHNVVIYRNEFNSVYIVDQETCPRHPREVYRNYCELCNHVCFLCTEHTKHRKTDFLVTFIRNRQQLREKINHISKRCLIERTTTDIKTFREEISVYESRIRRKAERLTAHINSIVHDVECNENQKKEIIRHIVSIQTMNTIFNMNSQQLALCSS